MGKPQVIAAVAGRNRRFIVPLQHTESVGKGAFVLGDLGRREEKDFGLYVCRFDFAILNFRSALPKSCALMDPIVFDDEPLEPAHAGALELGVQRRGRVLPDQEHAFHFALGHGGKHRHMRVIADYLGVPVIAETVFRRGRIAVHRFEIRHHKFGQVGPVASRSCLAGQKINQRVVRLKRGGV